MDNPATMFDPPFEIIEPSRHSLPMVFNSPHSGRVYPQPFLSASRLDAHSLRKSEDCYVDELFSGVVDHGAPLMRANFPRAYLDLNREPYELDPMMFSDPLPEYVNTRSVRAAGGLGTIARIVSEAAEIYGRPLTFSEAQTRIRALYLPYHRKLRALIAATREHFGSLLMIDCHSMPSSLYAGATGRGTLRPDFVLGDRYGAACTAVVTEFVGAFLARLGYSVVHNKPYAGGYITQAYGLPHKGVHALQIEINRSLYVDEDTLEKHTGFADLGRDLMALTSALAGALPDLLGPQAIAAE